MDRYRGWVSDALAPLEEFIDHEVDPRLLFTELLEIAEGETARDSGGAEARRDDARELTGV